MLIQQIIKKAIADPVGCELIPPLQRAEEQ
jgi:hypothetical protein